MADASFAQGNFLGGQWSPAAQGRFDHPAYRTALAASVNGLPVEEGAWTRRSGTQDYGHTYSSAAGQIKEFWLPNNQASILELTPSRINFWNPTPIAASGFGYVPEATGAGAGLATPYSTVAACEAVRVVQVDSSAVLLSGSAPWVLACSNYASVGPGVPPAFGFSLADMTASDGPYLDPLPGASQTNNSRGSVDGPGPTLNFTVLDGAYSFVSTDVGRQIRLWSQPPAWSSTAHYNAGAVVTFAGTYWTNLAGDPLSVGVQPGSVTAPPAGSTTVPTQAWGLAPAQAQWGYGYITADTSPTTVAVTLTSSWGTALPTAQNGNVIDTWQLGVFNDTTWPTCGCYHEGRLWLSGAVPGRYDGSVANEAIPVGHNFPIFSPTDQYGNVLDDSGISYPLNLTPVSNALWMEPDHAGIIVGTAAGEVLITASVLNDPLTPTSIQAHWATKYKSQNSEPVRMGIGIGFIQSFGRRLMEYVVDVFSQKFIGRHLNEFAKDLTTSGLKKIVYQEELAPVIWGVTNAGALVGCTYRRVSNFGTEGPLFNGWHVHELGSSRKVLWACSGTTASGTEDILVLLTQDAQGFCHLEGMQPLFDVDQPLNEAWFLDSAFSTYTLSGSDNSGSTITISGLPAATGNTDYSVFLAGLYCGTYQVSNGSIAVPYGSDPDGYLTPAWLRANQSSVNGVVIDVSGTNVTVPCVVGFPYSSTFKLLRPVSVQDLRTQTGPGLAKTRRIHMYGVQLSQTITGAQVSVDAGPTSAMKLVAPDQQTLLDHTELYDGVFWDTIDDDMSFDGQITIAQGLPYPLTLASVTGFVHAQDR